MSTTLDQFKTPSSYGFSATKIANLGASEYTLVTIAIDESGSVSGFWDEIKACVSEVVRSCMKSPRADNLMIRLVKFSDNLTEVHGFKMLSECNADDYKNIPFKGGNTALYDACENAITASNLYGKQLYDQEFSANGIVVVVTDGLNNNSAYGVNEVKQALKKAVVGENLESMVSILVGVNVSDSMVADGLDKFHKDAEFTQFVVIQEATKNKLAKLAQFVSKSISAQSQALGTNGPSKSLTF